MLRDLPGTMSNLVATAALSRTTTFDPRRDRALRRWRRQGVWRVAGAVGNRRPHAGGSTSPWAPERRRRRVLRWPASGHRGLCVSIVFEERWQQGIALSLILP